MNSFVNWEIPSEESVPKNPCNADVAANEPARPSAALAKDPNPAEAAMLPIAPNVPKLTAPKKDPIDADLNRPLAVMLPPEATVDAA